MTQFSDKQRYYMCLVYDMIHKNLIYNVCICHVTMYWFVAITFSHDAIGLENIFKRSFLFFFDTLKVYSIDRFIPLSRYFFS